MLKVIKPGHEYVINIEGKHGIHLYQRVHFQNGPVKEVGKNGIQNIDLLDILLDRLEYLQTQDNGKYACNENKDMLDHLRKCKEIDKERTRAREKRKVEGTNSV